MSQAQVPYIYPPINQGGGGGDGPPELMTKMMIVVIQVLQDMIV